MQKERVFALVLGLIMISSVAGFASFGLNFTGNAANPQPQQQAIPSISLQPFTAAQISAILGNGRVLVQSAYGQGCGSCKETDAAIQAFVQAYQGFLFMESVALPGEGGFEKLQMISPQGTILDLKEADITTDFLFQSFCDLAVVQPKECILSDYASGFSQGGQDS